MKTDTLSTLNIHKLTKAQYERELEAGNIDPNSLYLTPDEEITASDIDALGNRGDQTLDGSFYIIDSNNSAYKFGMIRTIDSVDYKLLVQPNASTLNLYYYQGDTLVNALQLNPTDTSFRRPVSITAGGTGANNGATGLANLFASGATIISPNQYGDTLPDAGTEGRIFFKKV